MFKIRQKHFYRVFIVCFYLTSFFLFDANSIFASENRTIEGKVEIFDRHGKLREDCSGVVVFLDDLEKPPPMNKTNQKARIEQINKKFSPEVLAVEVGTTVDFPNNDAIFHNVFSLSKVKPFDLGIYGKGDSRSVALDQPGLIKVYCNIHPQMIASILVLPHSYFAVTDRDGRFTLFNVPLGKSTVRTWYSRSRQNEEFPVQMTEEGLKNLNLTIIEDLNFRLQEKTVSFKHKNKWGQDYPSKY